MPRTHAKLKLIAPTASPDEAAAIVAALEQFMRATAPPPHLQPANEAPDGWRRAAIVEGVSREPGAVVPDPWINT